MYAQYFGLRENPFALPPDPRYLYLSLRHQEALAHLMYGITQSGGFVQLTGEVGTGKTMMIRALLERLPENIDIALILYPFLSVREFVAAICDELRVSYPAKSNSIKDLIDALNGYLLQNHAKGRRTVLIIDEAQKLSRDVMEQVRLLTNLETTKEKLLQILLIGQPELNNMLAQPDLRQLAQRITARYNLKALLPNETAEYVVHRCRVAGAQASLFSKSALKWIHRLSGGTPRAINVICDRALLGAYASGKAAVGGAMVRHAASEIGKPSPINYSWRAGIAAVAFGLIAIVGWAVSIIGNGLRHEELAVASVASPKVSEPTVSRPMDLKPKPISPPTVTAAEAPRTHETVTVADLFKNPTRTNPDTAFSSLFAQWRRDYASLSGGTACERAQSAGLRCIFTSGTWNNLRQYNRPAVIELLDATGNKHHLLVTGLSDDVVSVAIGEKTQQFSLAEINRYWYGKFLLLWMPPPVGEATLRRGMHGEGVSWLREALARYRGGPESTLGGDSFDAELEEQVKDFQRRHHLDDDGIVGRLTLVQLNGYHAATPPPLLAKTERRAPS